MRTGDDYDDVGYKVVGLRTRPGTNGETENVRCSSAAAAFTERAQTRYTTTTSSRRAVEIYGQTRRMKKKILGEKVQTRVRTRRADVYYASVPLPHDDVILAGRYAHA